MKLKTPLTTKIPHNRLGLKAQQTGRRQGADRVSIPEPSHEALVNSRT